MKHTISVTNNFGGGNVKIDGVTKVNGSTAVKSTGENLMVGAIDQPNGNYNYIWNQSGVNNSDWQKKLKGAQNFTTIQMAHQEIILIQ